MRERAQRFDPRQTMQRDQFEVFHYREPRSRAVEVHHHDFYEVYYLLRGEVDYWVDGRIIRLTAGDLLLMNPTQLHRPILEREDQPYERIVLWINKEFLEGLVTGGGELGRCFDTQLPGHTQVIRPVGAERSVLTARMGELVREFYSKEFGSELSAYGLFLQLMVELNRMALRGEGQQQEIQQMSPLVENTLHYISQNLGQPMTVEQIASRLYVSKYHLLHAFTREVGVSVYRYIMMRRLLMAREQLFAGQPAGQVCRNCGFADYASFYRAFKSEYGISPREFTARSQSENA